MDLPKKNEPELIPHVSELIHGGIIALNFFFESGRLYRGLGLTRDELWKLRLEIDRWFLTHSGKCGNPECSFEHPGLPHELVTRN